MLGTKRTVITRDSEDSYGPYRGPGGMTLMLASLAFLLAGAAPQAADVADVKSAIKIGGTGCSLGSLKLLGEAFEKSRPGVKVVLVPGLGTTGGIKAAAQGVVDIGVGSRPMKDEERKFGLRMREYAKTPLVFVTRKDTRKSGLSSDELARILKGEMTSWPDGQRIRLILRPPTDSETDVVKTLSPSVSSAMDAALSRQGIRHALTTQECVELIGNSPGAFGFSTLTMIITEKRDFNILPLNGVTPSVETVTDGSYPLSHLLYLVIKPESPEHVKAFVDFVLSPAGGSILKESGNLPLFSQGVQVPGRVKE